MAGDLHDRAHYEIMAVRYAIICIRLDPQVDAPSLSDFRRALQAAHCANSSAFCIVNPGEGLFIGQFHEDRSVRALRSESNSVSPTPYQLLCVTRDLITEIDDIYFRRGRNDGRDFMPERHHNVLQAAQLSMLKQLAGYKSKTATELVRG